MHDVSSCTLLQSLVVNQDAINEKELCQILQTTNHFYKTKKYGTDNEKVKERTLEV